MTPEFPRIQTFVVEVKEVERRRKEEYSYLKSDNLLMPLRGAAAVLAGAYPDTQLSITNPNTPSVRASVDLRLRWGFFVVPPEDSMDTVSLSEWNEVVVAASRDINGVINGIKLNNYNVVVDPQDSNGVVAALDYVVTNPNTEERRLSRYSDQKKDSTREEIPLGIPGTFVSPRPNRRPRLGTAEDNLLRRQRDNRVGDYEAQLGRSEPLPSSSTDITHSWYDRSVHVPGQGLREKKTEFKGSIREMKASDLVKIRPVLRQWLRDRIDRLVIQDEVDSTLQAMKDSVEGKNERKYFVAETNKKKVIGVIGMKLPDEQMNTYTETSRPAELVNAYVAAEYRKGLGVGRMLVRALEHQLVQQGYTELVLNSGPRYKETGWGFYDRLSGYRRVGVAKDMYGENVDAPVWRKSFTVPAVINA